MKPLIIPTIFSKNRKEFREKFDKLIKITKNIQVDYMDGKFVSAKSVQMKDIPRFPRNYNFEIHMMSKNPSKGVGLVAKKGFRKVLFHYGTDDNVKTIAKIKEYGMLAFLAVNPEDKTKDFAYLFPLLDGILVMGVHPGGEKQSLLPGTFNKIKEIRKINSKIPIQVDGGVNMSTIKKLTGAGVSLLNSGSFVSGSDNPRKALAQLKRIANS